MACAQGRNVEAEVTLFEGDTEEAATCITQDNVFLDSVEHWILVKFLDPLSSLEASTCTLRVLVGKVAKVNSLSPDLLIFCYNF